MTAGMMASDKKCSTPVVASRTMVIPRATRNTTLFGNPQATLITSNVTRRWISDCLIDREGTKRSRGDKRDKRHGVTFSRRRHPSRVVDLLLDHRRVRSPSPCPHGPVGSAETRDCLTRLLAGIVPDAGRGVHFRVTDGLIIREWMIHPSYIACRMLLVVYIQRLSLSLVACCLSPVGNSIPTHTLDHRHLRV